MRFFRFPKRTGQYKESESPMQRFFRYILISLLFCAVIWGFWINNERRMEMLRKPAAAALDSTGTLSGEQERSLAAFQERFGKVYGINLVIVIRPEPFPEPYLTGSERAGTIFLGLCPPNRQVVLEMPPLAEASLGGTLAGYLREEHFEPFFIAGNWPEGLVQALNIMTRQLDSVLLTRPAEKS
jgi:hypothetical protein